MIIINEYQYAKDIMDSLKVPENMSVKELLRYIAKYYYQEDYTTKEYMEIIFDKIREFNLSSSKYQEYKYENYVKNMCVKLLSGDMSHILRDIKSVCIYESEIEIINKCENDKQKKLLFTLYVLAKINNSNGWVNYELKDVFSLANVTATIEDRCMLIHDLYKNGLIQQTYKVDSQGCKVELGSADENVAVSINSFVNIGNQYISLFKPGWKMCECCGKLFKVKGSNSKYCKACARAKELEKYMRYNEKR